MPCREASRVLWMLGYDSYGGGDGGVVFRKINLQT